MTVLHDPTRATTDRPGSTYDRRDFRAHLWDGRNVKCTAIEQDTSGALWVHTTRGERFPDSAVRQIVRHLQPVPSSTPTGDALDAFLAGFPGVKA